MKLKACWDYKDARGDLRTYTKIVANVTEADNFFKDKKNELEKGVEVLCQKHMTFAEYVESYKTTHLVPAVIRVKRSKKGAAIVRGAVKVSGLEVTRIKESRGEIFG